MQGTSKIEEIDGNNYKYNNIEIEVLDGAYRTPCIWIAKKDNLPSISMNFKPAELNSNDLHSEGVYAKIFDLNQSSNPSEEDKKMCDEIIECGINLCFKTDPKFLRVLMVEKYQQLQYTTVDKIQTIDYYLD